MTWNAIECAFSPHSNLPIRQIEVAEECIRIYGLAGQTKRDHGQRQGSTGDKIVDGLALNKKEGSDADDKEDEDGADDGLSYKGETRCQNERAATMIECMLILTIPYPIGGGSTGTGPVL